MRLDLVDPEALVRHGSGPFEQFLELSQRVGPHEVAHVDDVALRVARRRRGATARCRLVRRDAQARRPR